MRIKTTFLGSLVALAACVGLQAQAEQIDLLRTVPLEIKGYEVSKNFPSTFTTADQVLAAIDSSPVLLVHMEAIRRSYADLPAAEKAKLLAALKKRHQLKENDLQLGFDHGYAELVHQNNKTGLFFLRKANDKMQTQFSSLAYGMAQVEADLNLEGATPEAMTTRKMDAMYKLGDAVKFDAANHQPGFWPSYMRVIEKIRPLPLYQSFSNRDFTLVYLPQGNRVIPLGSVQTSGIPLTTDPEQLIKNALHTSCDPNVPDPGIDSPDRKPISQRQVTLNGSSAQLEVLPSDKPGLYRVRVISGGQLLLSFETYNTSRLVEDLDGDGSFEIVSRQYKQDPYNPVLVYRHTPCGFELDKTVFNSFH